MTGQNFGAFARRHKWKIIHGHLAAVAVGVLAAFLAGAFAAHTVFGQHLDKRGTAIYQQVRDHGLEMHQRQVEHEMLPPSQAAAVAKTNDAVAAAVAASPVHPLATPQPAFKIDAVRNQSRRQTGARPLLWVVHDTESPNVLGLQDDYAIVAWFNNPVSQASSNYVTDAEGNTIQMVPCNASAKAWHVAFFNSWACGDELIGHATQTVWPDPQLRAAAQLAAHDMGVFKIPIQQAVVRGCTIVRPGILEHLNLGACGGGHHDAGAHFPLTRFIGLVKAYAVGGFHPTPHPKPKPVFEPVAPSLLRTRAGYWSWLAWRLGQQAWKGYGRANPTVRPHVPTAIPPSWWAQANLHLKGAHA